MPEEVQQEVNYPLSRIMHVLALIFSIILILVGIHILIQEEDLKYELYLYWFIAIYVMSAMVVKMFMVVRADHSTKRIVLGFAAEFLYFLPVVLNDWQRDKFEFALAMLITSVVRLTYYIFAVMKNSQLV